MHGERCSTSISSSHPVLFHISDLNIAEMYTRRYSINLSRVKSVREYPNIEA